MENAGKRYLYHGVPRNVEKADDGRTIIHPLNMLKEKFPGLYELEAQKYGMSEYRRQIPEKLIPTLKNAAWGDVVQLTAVHPNDLLRALREVGVTPRELKFYQVDPELLDPSKTTIFLHREDLEDTDPNNFAPYDPAALEEHATIPDETKKYFREVHERGRKPFLFVGVPHIFHHGPIDVSNFPVIIAEIPDDISVKSDE